MFTFNGGQGDMKCWKGKQKWDVKTRLMGLMGGAK